MNLIFLDNFRDRFNKLTDIQKYILIKIFFKPDQYFLLPARKKKFSWTNFFYWVEKIMKHSLNVFMVYSVSVLHTPAHVSPRGVF